MAKIEVKCPYCNNENISILDEGFEYIKCYCSNCNDTFSLRYTGNAMEKTNKNE